MRELTQNGRDKIQDLAQRYGVSTDAVMTLLEALVQGHGTMAQFYCNELGGGGQWMQGGMTMVGDMFNYGLKSKVDGLCSELSNLLASQPFAPTPTSSQSQSQGAQQQYQGGGGYASSMQNGGQYQNGDNTASLFVAPAPGTSGDWWPGDIGFPNATGSQNGVRYAYFAGARRLAVEVNGTLGLYDTLDHQIGGFSQQQGSGGSITFTSQYGTVFLTSLPVIYVRPVGSSGNASSSYASTPSGPSVSYDASGTTGFTPAPNPSGNYATPSSTGGSANESDIFAALERLASLKQKGILTDEEFAAKKAELLSRL